METEIELGDTVRCIHTGFTGTAVVKSIFINGCVQYEVLPKSKKKDVMPEAQGIDVASLEVVSNCKKEAKETETGGPMSKPINRRGF